MQTKLKEKLQLLKNTTLELNDPQRWMAFLDTSSRLYKYSFQDQVMLYAQKPEAVACAEYNVWQDVANRRVKFGSKGIALIDNSQSTPKLRYVYDHKDTAPSKGANKAKVLWRITEKNKWAVWGMLKERYGTDTTLEMALQEVAKRVAQAHTDESPQSQIIEKSVAYMLLAKCGYEPQRHIALDDFRDIQGFNPTSGDAIEAINTIGNAVSELAEPILRQIENTVKDFERSVEQENEQKLQQNRSGRNDVHRRNNRRDTGTDGRGSTGIVREPTAGSNDTGRTDGAVLRGRTETDNRDLRQGKTDVPAQPQAGV